MKKDVFLFVLYILYALKTYSQSSIELITAAGEVFSDKINYQRCTGHVDPAFQFSLSFIYHPNPVFGLELTYMDENPITYLDAPDNTSVKVYTSSQITVQRLLGGLNMSLPVKRFNPFLGCLLGVTNVTTTKAYDTNELTSFTWTLQTGVYYYFSSLIGVRIKFSVIQTPNVSNNSAYFDIGKSGDGFPTFAVGDPSTANITQLNLALGFIFHFQSKYGKEASANHRDN